MVSSDPLSIVPSVLSQGNYTAASDGILDGFLAVFWRFPGFFWYDVGLGKL
jgi:hypothetical protein